jgi:hypothetical protein
MNASNQPLSEPHLILAEMGAHDEYKVCKDDHDPRGWTVRARNNFDLGRVTDLIIDEVALNARYLVCDVVAAQHRVLVPTGFARLDDKEKVVYLDFLTEEDLERLPVFHGLPLTAAQQLEVETALTGREQFEPASIIQRRIERRD